MKLHIKAKSLLNCVGLILQDFVLFFKYTLLKLNFIIMERNWMGNYERLKQQIKSKRSNACMVPAPEVSFKM